MTLPVPHLKLPVGPEPVTAEQRYWKSFKNQLLISLPGGKSVTHISSPATYHTSAAAAASSSSSSSTTAGTELFAVTSGSRVQLYSTRTRKLVKSIARFQDTARSAEIRRDGRILVAGEDSGRIQIFDVNSRSILRTWTEHTQPVWTTKFAPTDATTVLSASDDRTVRLWDIPSQTSTHTFVGHMDYVRCATFLPGLSTSTNLIASGSYDATVRLWDPRRSSTRAGAVMTFRHEAPVESVLALSTGLTLLAAAGSQVSVLDLVAGRPLQVLANHQKTVTAMTLASQGKRLLTGGLDGHVKVYETTGWNVVNSTRYPAPVLSLAVVTTHANAAPGTPASSSWEEAVDRHVAVGMSTGTLSIRTRLTGADATRERAREKEMAALLRGTIDQHDAQLAQRKRLATAEKQLQQLGEDADVTILNDKRALAGGQILGNNTLASGKSATIRKLPRWQRCLQEGEYAASLDHVLDKHAPGHEPAHVFALLVALRHRQALTAALSGRDEESVQPILQWTNDHLGDPRLVNVCVEVGLTLLQLYGAYAVQSTALRDGFRSMRRRVRMEVERAHMAVQTQGMMQSLMQA